MDNPNNKTLFFWLISLATLSPAINISLRTPNKHDRIANMDKVVNFVNQSVEELKKIRGPSRKETIRLTGYVIGVSLGVGLFVMFFDYIFAQLVTLLLTR